MNKKILYSYLTFCLLIIFSLEAKARVFEMIQVPDAHCGDGSDYFVLVDIRNTKKVVVAFEGGGACWDLITCATQISTQLSQPTDFTQSKGFFSDDARVSPFSDASMIFFPYCTGDIFAGSYTQKYDGVYKVEHVGRKNVVQGLDVVLNIYGSLLKKSKEVVFYGYSAGALGVMMNFTDLDQKLGRFIPKKSVILDGMGLHWDEKVWNRFDKAMLQAIKDGFKRVNVDFNPNEWPLSKKSLEVCRQYPQYQFGLLQGSMDFVMGVLFGFMSPLEHRKRVYGADGIYETLQDPRDNCAAFVPDTFTHTFLTSEGSKGVGKKSKSGITAFQFAKNLMTDGASESYR